MHPFHLFQSISKRSIVAATALVLCNGCADGENEMPVAKIQDVTAPFGQQLMQFHENGPVDSLRAMAALQPGDWTKVCRFSGYDSTDTNSVNRVLGVNYFYPDKPSRNAKFYQGGAHDGETLLIFIGDAGVIASYYFAPWDLPWRSNLRKPCIDRARAYVTIKPSNGSSEDRSLEMVEISE